MTTAVGRPVGFDLQDSEDSHPIVEAIERDNPYVTVLRLPGIIKLVAPHELTVNRSTVETLIGRPWDTYEFQMAIVSYIGDIAEWDEDHILIRWQH